MTGPDTSRGTRLAAHGSVSAALALCSDRQLRELVDAATPLGAGIGGQTALLKIDDVPVFVKRLRLTDLERRPENLRSTANLFGLPSSCHYGIGTIGGPGFGAWRELAVHLMTTGWVISGDHEGFPLTYHWRVLPDAGHPLPEELADVDRAVAYWGGGPAVHGRIEALRRSTASILVFQEYVPQNLHEWLSAQVEIGGEVAERACALVDHQLRAVIEFMNTRGMQHFDAHFENILTDGERLYVADYGLAICSRFELARDEADFLDEHRDYDRSFTAMYLVNWLAVAFLGHAPEERTAFVRSCAQGSVPEGFPPSIAALLVRDAPLAAVLGEFSRRFRQESRTVPYPHEAIRRAAGLGAAA